MTVMFTTEAMAAIISVKYTDKWDQDNIIRSEYKQIPREVEADDLSNAAAPELRLKLEEFVKNNKNLRQQDLIAQIWHLIFGSRTTTTTESPSGTTTTTTTAATTTDLSDATLSGRTRRTTKYKIRGYCKNPPKAILPENDTTEAP